MSNFNVPFDMSHLVCECDPDEVYRNFPNYYKGEVGKHKCVKCSKYRRTFTAHCRNCKKMFINLFDHPLRCRLSPVCWPCLESFDTSACEVYISGNCALGGCERDRAGRGKTLWYPDLLDVRERVTTFKIPTLPKAWTPTGK